MAHDYSDRYDPETDFDRHLTRASGRRIRRWFRPGDRVLEIGCATGAMTALFAERDVQVDAVERTPAYHARAVARELPGVTVHLTDVEDYRSDTRYEQIVVAHVLNEVADPAGLLGRLRADFLAPGGLVHVTLTNPLSLHRLVALEMGLLDRLEGLSSRGEEFSTVEIFDGRHLERLVADVGLTCVHREPVLLKPFTNAQLDHLGDDVIAGLDRVAARFPEHGALNYAIFVAEG